jgi:glycosyltransferase involved in cell wall biosynthesis
VAASVPGTREVLDHAGIVVQRMDPARLAEGLTSLLTDEAARRDLGRRAVARAEGRYSQERMLDATERAWRRTTR